MNKQEQILLKVLGEGEVVAYDKRCYVAGADGELHPLPKSSIYDNLEHLDRPWGVWYSLFKDLRSSTKYQIKKILVNPGAKLSLQVHHHRSEHWIVLSGAAKVTCGEQLFNLYPGQSTFIPMGEKHSLENPGMIDLEIIEIQMGEVISEKDITRLDHGFDSGGNQYI